MKSSSSPLEVLPAARFADERDQVMVYDKQTGAEYETSVTNAAVETDFYTVQGPNGPSDIVETEVMGSRIEGPGKTALDNVDAADQLRSQPVHRVLRETSLVMTALLTGDKL